MTVRYSRGSPLNCEFCGVIVVDGRQPRTKAVTQVLGEFISGFDTDKDGTFDRTVDFYPASIPKVIR
jgi:hypothetical protein